MTSHFRVARHTNNLEQIKGFYVNLLGLELLGEFDHEGYLGAFVGEKQKDWHLEFTQSSESAKHMPDEDDLLVFYHGAGEQYDQCLERFATHGIQSVISKNPYWDQWGKTFLDPDGFRVVICFRDWSND